VKYNIKLQLIGINYLKNLNSKLTVECYLRFTTVHPSSQGSESERSDSSLDDESF